MKLSLNKHLWTVTSKTSIKPDQYGTTTRMGPFVTFAYFFLFGGRVVEDGNKRSSKKHEVSDISIQWREKYGTGCEISGDGPCLITKPGHARCWKNHVFIIRIGHHAFQLLKLSLKSSPKIYSYQWLKQNC